MDASASRVFPAPARPARRVWLLPLAPLLVLPAAWFLANWHFVGQQREAARRLAALGGRVYHDYQLDARHEPLPPAQARPAAWCEFVGVDWRHDVTRVDLDQSAMDDGQMAVLRLLPRLRVLRLTGLPITDASVPHLLELRQLRHLDARGSDLSEAGVARLRKHLANAEILFESRSGHVAKAMRRAAPAFARRFLRPLERAEQRELAAAFWVAQSHEAARQWQEARPWEASDEPTAPEVNAAIERGLRYLAAVQHSEGNWTLRATVPALAVSALDAARSPDTLRPRPTAPGVKNEPPRLESPAAATGLALLAFLGAGQHHAEPPFQNVIAAGLQALLERQQENGDLYTPGDPASSDDPLWLYSHAIATLALCEAYGMTQDPALRDSAQRALDFLAAAQDRELGGWRYRPRMGSDTSVTGWAVLALHGGEQAGLRVPTSVWTGVSRWLDRAERDAPDQGFYAYNPLAADTRGQRHGRSPSVAMTAVGLLTRLQVDGPPPTLAIAASLAPRPAPELAAASESSEPAVDDAIGDAARRGAHHRRAADFLHKRAIEETDAYCWHAVSLAMSQMGGADWRRWRQAAYPVLLERQTRMGPLAGSWHPLAPRVDRWGRDAGRLYVTTLHLLALEAYYRQLPPRQARR